MRCCGAATTTSCWPTTTATSRRRIAWMRPTATANAGSAMRSPTSPAWGPSRPTAASAPTRRRSGTCRPGRSKPMLRERDIELICNARHGDPFSVLGLHDDADGWSLRVFLPAAAEVAMVHAPGIERVALERVHADGFFEAHAPGPRPSTY